jgi:hypothetical protein
MSSALPNSALEEKTNCLSRSALSMVYWRLRYDEILSRIPAYTRCPNRISARGLDDYGASLFDSNDSNKFRTIEKIKN